MFKYFILLIISSTYSFASPNEIQKPYTSADAEALRDEALSHLKEARDARDRLSSLREQQTIETAPDSKAHLTKELSTHQIAPKPVEVTPISKAEMKTHQTNQLKVPKKLSALKVNKCASPDESQEHIPQKKTGTYPNTLLYFKGDTK